MDIFLEQFTKTDIEKISATFNNLGFLRANPEFTNITGFFKCKRHYIWFCLSFMLPTISDQDGNNIKIDEIVLYNFNRSSEYDSAGFVNVSILEQYS